MKSVIKDSSADASKSILLFAGTEDAFHKEQEKLARIARIKQVRE
jgi:hypothetical protein